MAKVNKTCVVFGYFKSKDLSDDTHYNIFESAEIGKRCTYKTANDFIIAIKELHRRNSTNWAITNVVIG